MSIIESIEFWVWRIFNVRRGWKLGTPPDQCPNCLVTGKQIPACFVDIDEAWLHWACDECGCPNEDAPDIKWFARGDFIPSKRLKQMGFVLV